MIAHEKPVSYVRITPRTVARFAVVQAIFYELSRQKTWADIVAHFVNERFDDTGYDLFEEGPLFIDRSFFNHLSTCWGEQDQKTLDALFSPFLPKEWSLCHMEKNLYSILRCAVLEMKCCPDTPKPVLINEYILISQSFLQTSRLVNAVLEKVYRSLYSHQQ